MALTWIGGNHDRNLVAAGLNGSTHCLSSHEHGHSGEESGLEEHLENFESVVK